MSYKVKLDLWGSGSGAVVEYCILFKDGKEERPIGTVSMDANEMPGCCGVTVLNDMSITCDLIDKSFKENELQEIADLVSKDLKKILTLAQGNNSIDYEYTQRVSRFMVADVKGGFGMKLGKNRAWKKLSVHKNPKTRNNIHVFEMLPLKKVV